MEWITGIILVSIAGMGTGTIAWPMKLMRRLEFEQYWFVGMLAGLVVIPWAVVLTSVPNAFEAYAEVGWKPLLISNLFAAGWGIANVLYGICVVRIGAALTGAILTGLGVTVGVTLPMIFKGTGLFSEAPSLGSAAGIAVVCGVVVMLAGVAIVSVAGFLRERVLRETQTHAQASGGFLGGLIMVVIAGIASCGIALAFVYSQGPIVEAMKAHGAGDVSANFAVWAIGLLGGAAVNVLYPAYLMTRRKSWGMLLSCPRDLALGAIIGIQFMCAVAMLGRGMVLLGVLGASVGFGIQQALQIFGNQAVGFIAGEWKGIGGKARKLMYIALAVLCVAVVILAFANTLT